MHLPNPRGPRDSPDATVATNLPCAQCGYNLRGVPAKAVCPECGHLVADSLQGAAVRAGQREHANEALRNYAKSYLLSVPVGMIGVWCLGGPFVVMAMLGAFQRLLALRAAAAVLPPAAFGQTPEFERAKMVNIVELAVGAVCTVVLATPIASVIPVQFITTAMLVGIPALWIGTVGLGMICSAMLGESLDAHFALRLERSSAPYIATFTAVALQLAADVAEWSALGWGAMLLRFGAIGTWAWAAIATAHAFGSSAEEIASEPKEDLLKRPEDAPLVADAPLSPAERAARAAARKAARKSQEDDEPIALD